MTKADNILVQKCQNGEREAQNQLFTQYRRMLFGVCLRYAADREEVEDILQDSFIKIYGDLYQYKPTGPLGGWLRKVTVNVALQHLRKKKKLFPIVALDQIEDSYRREENLFEEDRAKALLKMVQQLPEGYRLIFNLHVMEGLTHPEIAKHLDISVNTSKSQLSRAKALLRKMLEKTVTQ